MIEPKLLIEKLKVIENLNGNRLSDIRRELEVFAEEYYKLFSDKYGNMDYDSYLEVEKAFKNGFLLGNLLSKITGGGETALSGVEIPMYQQENDDGFLIAHAKLTDDKRQWIVPKCPRCGKKHAHGAGNGTTDDPRRFLGHRQSDCIIDLSGHQKDGYVLEEIHT